MSQLASHESLWEGDQVTRCVVRDCGNPTSNAKPWCLTHVLTHAPYPRGLHRLENEEPSE